ASPGFGWESSRPLVMATPRAATANYRSGRVSRGFCVRPTTATPATGAAAGIACGIGAALFWAAGFAAARHGIAAGLSPADIILHRFVWAGLIFLPLLAREGLGDLGGVGWPKALLLTLAGGPTFAFFSYAGFLFVPLAHGGVIQPSCAALGGLAL